MTRGWSFGTLRVAVQLAAAAVLALTSAGLADGDTLAQVDPGVGARSVLVGSIGPFGDSVATGSAIVVTFQLPVNTDAVAFYIQPTVEGSLSWIDRRTLLFQPDRLEYGVRYRVTVGWRWNGWRLAGHPLRWTFTTAGSPALVIAPGPTSIRVPILLYHYVRVNPNSKDLLGYRLSVAPTVFQAQMDWLAANGYHTVTMQDLHAFLTKARGLPSKPIVLTFDDGYEDFYTSAMPILRAHGFTAVSYVVSGFVGQPGYMTAAQIETVEDSGFEVGDHTVNHVNLQSQTDAGLQFQLVSSKLALQALLGRPVVSFCYPYGRFGTREIAAVAAAGYEDATTEISGSWHSMADRYTWTRIRVTGGETLYDLVQSILFY